MVIRRLDLVFAGAVVAIRRLRRRPVGPASLGEVWTDNARCRVCPAPGRRPCLGFVPGYRRVHRWRRVWHAPADGGRREQLVSPATRDSHGRHDYGVNGGVHDDHGIGNRRETLVRRKPGGKRILGSRGPTGPCVAGCEAGQGWARKPRATSRWDRSCRWVQWRAWSSNRWRAAESRLRVVRSLAISFFLAFGSRWLRPGHRRHSHGLRWVVG